MGEFSSIKVRVDFTRAFFGSGGFEIINPGGFTKPGEVVKEALNSQAEIIVLISVDEAYPRLVSGVAGVIKERNPDIITVLAGDPKEKTKEYQAAGIDYFIHLKVNALDILSEVIEKIGIKNA